MTTPEDPVVWLKKKIEEARNAGNFTDFENYSEALANWLRR